jgi:hypothetical protein
VKNSTIFWLSFFSTTYSMDPCTQKLIIRDIPRPCQLCLIKPDDADYTAGYIKRFFSLSQKRLFLRFIDLCTTQGYNRDTTEKKKRV